MKKLNESQVRNIVEKLSRCKDKREFDKTIVNLSIKYCRPIVSIKSYYYRYKKLFYYVSKLEQDVKGQYCYYIKAEKGKLTQFKVKCRGENFVLYAKKRKTNIIKFPYVNKIDEQLDVQKALFKLADMVKNDKLSQYVLDKAKLKIVKTEIDKCKLSLCQQQVTKEKLLKQNLKLKKEIERLKEKIKQNRCLNLDKVE